MSKRALYIGRRVDADTLKVTDEPSLLDPDNLTRHAVCLGMTGSGKTGLCVSLLEELAAAGVPALIIDPKGDMTNLCLAFADSRPEDFAPWVDPAAASRAGLDVPAFAERTAAMWKKGLASWGMDAERIGRYTDGAQVTVYTPGSSAGVSVDVLSALGAPPAEVLEDAEGFREMVAGTVSALLGLVGVEADPVSDPAHIVLSQILTDAWGQGSDLDLETVITRLVDPPFGKVGVFPVDTFYPRNDRMKLAMSLNGIVASPAFGAWRQGAPMDVDGFLAPRDGRTAVSVFYTAHLDDAQRMFFISMLLNQVVTWSRRQSGTSSLRALVYFDEVFGYLPPHPKNPPTKTAVLTLMKQARAVGVGTMLVTQNPVDLDYKALSNAGTWLIGRLQTKQDRERVLDGLASAAGGFDRGVVSNWLENLPSRTFVWRDVSKDDPVLVHSRWAISYLRGPLTRRELDQLPAVYRTLPGAARSRPAAAASPQALASTPGAPADNLLAQPPPAPAGYRFRFLDPRLVFSARLAPFFEHAALPKRPDGKLVWVPALIGKLHVRFDEGAGFSEERHEQRLFFPITDHGIEEAGDPELTEDDYLPSPPPDSLFAHLPTQIDEKHELQALEKRVIEHIYRGETAKLFRHRDLKLTSTAGETREHFQVRVEAAIREKIDAEVGKLKEKVDREVTRLEDRKRKLEQDQDKYKAEARSHQANELVSAGEALFGMFFGRKRSLTGVVSKRQTTMRAQERLSRATDDAAKLEREVYELQNQTETEILKIENRWKGEVRGIEEVEVRLKRNGIRLDEFSVLWVPLTRLF